MPTPLFDTFGDARFDQAQTLAQAGDPAAALTVLGQVGSSQAQRHYEDALVLASRSDVGTAISLLKRAVAADPDHLPSWQKRLELGGNQADMEEACRQSLRLDPRQTAISLRLSQLQEMRQDLAAALSTLEAALPFSTAPLELHLTLGRLYKIQGDFPAAETHLRTALGLAPVEKRAFDPLLDILDRLDRIAEGEALCRTFLTHQASDPMVRAHLAQSLVRQKRWADADQIYIELLTEFPGWVQLRQVYAEQLKQDGRAELALDIHEANIGMTGGTAEAYMQLSDMQQERGLHEAAARSLQLAAQHFQKSGPWGLNMLPTALSSRLIFNQLKDIAAHYCSGTRALEDHTGLDMHTPNRYALGEVVEMFCMVVGQEHIDFLEYVAYPSLIATEGFDQLLQTRKVIYNIYTTPGDYPALASFLSKLRNKGIPYRVNVEIFSFSQDLYTILCLPIIDQVKRALQLNSAVVMSLPDAIISGSIARVLEDMQPGETVACAMPRINTNKAYPTLRAELESTSKGLDSRRFVRQAMTDFIHPQTYAALKTDSNCLRYRDMGGYYEARNWAPPPLCFYARQEMLDHMLEAPLCGWTSMASFYAIDHDFVESAYRAGKLRLIPDSDYFFWAEFTQPDRHTDFLAGRKSENYYYPEANQYIYAHPFKWIYAD